MRDWQCAHFNTYTSNIDEMCLRDVKSFGFTKDKKYKEPVYPCPYSNGGMPKCEYFKGTEEYMANDRNIPLRLQVSLKPVE